MKYIELFAGIGGFGLALNRLGHECVYANEWDKYAAQIYNRRFSDNRYFGEEKTEGELSTERTSVESESSESSVNSRKPTPVLCDTRDIRTVPTSEIPNHDLLVAGFPCQAFSIAGKRRGFNDTRGTLFFEIARILKDKQPKFFILENVKGLLSHDNGNTFKTIISTLTELGYDLQWQVLNSKNFGVPQNRERVFIVGHLRGQPRPEVFPIGTSNTENEPERVLAHTLNSSDWRGANRNQKQTTIRTDEQNTQGGISQTLAGNAGGQGAKTGLYAIKKLGNIYPSGSENGDVISPDGISKTLKSGENSPKILENMKIRRLTPVECERLQGFPDVEKYCIIEVCKQVNANGAERTLNIKVIDQDNAAQPNVLIDCVENGVEIHSQGKLLLNAKNVEKKNWSHQHIKIDDFVQMLVGINTIAEKTTGLGGEVSFQNEQCLTTQKSGKKQENKYGNEITLPVGYAENDLTTLKELLKFITSNPLDTKSLEQKLTTLSLFVIRAINGYIPSEILNQDTFTIGIKTKVGFTYGISDTQRYKVLGNAVSVPVVEAIAKRLTL